MSGGARALYRACHDTGHEKPLKDVDPMSYSSADVGRIVRCRLAMRRPP